MFENELNCFESGVTSSVVLQRDVILNLTNKVYLTLAMSRQL